MDCKKRKIGCHSSCLEYSDFSKQIKVIKENRAKVGFKDSLRYQNSYKKVRN
ncbi:hypothetical protein [Peptoniphilus rhinitidis]|uniref:hypothetical protein n=1 Tax=Peptoniphilus rhinitidis TaxID=1175452 RepID=UPI00292FB058|nr:hypothetical protein [Peptoniphilus rhinitidis]